VDRLVVVWCPTLAVEGERGEEVRRFLDVVATVEAFCPWVEPARLGVCTLPARGPARFFGGEAALVGQLSGAVTEVLGAPEAVRVGVADGLFAALLAARAEVVVDPGGMAPFLAPWSTAVLRRPDLAVTLKRLGVHTLGQFAALGGREVSARFGSDALTCHRVARGEEGDLVGLRDPAVARRLRRLDGELPDVTPQAGFFGGVSDADVRAARTLARLQERLGPEAVVVGRLSGGRGPAERARLLPWGSRDADPASAPVPDGAPWPGRLPPPSPVTVLLRPRPAEVVDRADRPVRVTGRGLLSASPQRISVDGGPFADVGAWAGPYPATDRWWSTRRRQARLQVVLDSGGALLLAAERGHWSVEAAYD